MELAKVTAHGQITIPVAVRNLLSIKDGDKVLFVRQGNSIVMMNATIQALDEVQDAMRGVADELGLKDEQDVVEMIKEMRAERKR